jgi:hypothetical protein
VDDDPWADSEVLLRTWLRRAREGQHGHHEAGKVFRRADYWLKIPIVIITTALGTAAFATLTVHISGGAKIGFGVLSIVAAVLASLQVHLRYAERAERHKNLGAQYGAIRRRIEAVLALQRASRGNPSHILDELRYKLDAIANEGEAVSRRVWDRTRSRLAGQDAVEDGAALPAGIPKTAAGTPP